MLRLFLLAEGSSDEVLRAPLSWMLNRDPAVDAFAIDRVDFGRLPSPPRTLSERIARVVEVDAPDILLVHRDSDGRPFEERVAEIRVASGDVDCVPVVPVRMSETWFLFDQTALRLAAGSTDESIELDLPRLTRLEATPNPKRRLRKNLEKASGLRGRRLAKFDWRAAYHRLSQKIDDFEPLLALPSFARTVEALSDAVHEASLRKRTP